jgi:hypothetical protein
MLSEDVDMMANHQEFLVDSTGDHSKFDPADAYYGLNVTMALTKQMIEHTITACRTLTEEIRASRPGSSD